MPSGHCQFPARSPTDESGDRRAAAPLSEEEFRIQGAQARWGPVRPTLVPKRPQPWDRLPRTARQFASAMSKPHTPIPRLRNCIKSPAKVSRKRARRPGEGSKTFEQRGLCRGRIRSLFQGQSSSTNALSCRHFTSFVLAEYSVFSQITEGYTRMAGLDRLTRVGSDWHANCLVNCICVRREPRATGSGTARG